MDGVNAMLQVAYAYTRTYNNFHLHLYLHKLIELFLYNYNTSIHHTYNFLCPTLIPNLGEV